MTLIILLFAIGILFLVVEVIIPGGILGTIGALLMFGACYLAYVDFGALGGTIATITAFLIGCLALYFEFRILPRTKIGKRAFLNSAITGVSASTGKEELELVGKSAEAITMLSPSGYVRVDGRRYEAFCQSGQVEAGSILDIIGADNFRLIVTPRKTN